MKCLSCSDLIRGYESENASYCNLILNKIRSKGKQFRWQCISARQATDNEMFPEKAERTLPAHPKRHSIQVVLMSGSRTYAGFLQKPFNGRAFHSSCTRRSSRQSAALTHRIHLPMSITPLCPKIALGYLWSTEVPECIQNRRTCITEISGVSSGSLHLLMGFNSSGRSTRWGCPSKVYHAVTQTLSSEVSMPSLGGPDWAL